jgi:hypothetical protein
MEHVYCMMLLYHLIKYNEKVNFNNNKVERFEVSRMWRGYNDDMCDWQAIENVSDVFKWHQTFEHRIAQDGHFVNSGYLEEDTNV